MAQILLPTREVERQEAPKESPMDKLLKGLQVAGSVFGIASNISNLSTQSQARTIAEAKEGREAAKFGLETQRTTMQAPEGVPGTEITLKTPEGESVTSLRVPRPQEISLAAKQQAQLRDLQIKTAEKRLKQQDTTVSKSFQMPEEEKQSWRNRGVSDEIISLVEAGYGGRNPASTLNQAAEKDEPNTAEINTINGFDETDLVMDELFSDVKPEYVGPIDGRLPDMAIGPGQAKFRAQMRRLNAAYRRAITGLTASDKEAADLLSQLPNERDKFDNWMAKAKGFKTELSQKRRLYLQSLEQGGKFVDPFKEMGSTSAIVNNRVLLPINPHRQKDSRTFQIPSLIPEAQADQPFNPDRYLGQ
jgi:hypothetical protein